MKHFVKYDGLRAYLKTHYVIPECFCRASISMLNYGFPLKHALSSIDFYRRYENVEMGDEMDFVEWAATVEMQVNANKRLKLLKKEF